MCQHLAINWRLIGDFRIVLYSNRRRNERQKRAIEYLRRNEQITNTEFQEINKTTKKTATRDLQELVRSGILIKSGRTGRGVYYSLNPTYKGDIRGHKGTRNNVYYELTKISLKSRQKEGSNIK